MPPEAGTPFWEARGDIDLRIGIFRLTCRPAGSSAGDALAAAYVWMGFCIAPMDLRCG